LKPPYFQIFDNKFLDILGPTPSVRVIVENDTFAFAHEAPMWVPGTDDVYFNGGKTVGRPVCATLSLSSSVVVTLSKIIFQVSMINLGELKNSPTGLINFTTVSLVVLRYQIVQANIMIILKVTS
jgi:gluconolactonase